jgi:hypothetical protein
MSGLPNEVKFDCQKRAMKDLPRRSRNVQTSFRANRTRMETSRASIDARRSGALKA